VDGFHEEQPGDHPGRVLLPELAFGPMIPPHALRGDIPIRKRLAAWASLLHCLLEGFPVKLLALLRGELC